MIDLLTRTDPRFVEQLIRHEMDEREFKNAKIFFPYKCPAGKLTIGVGHNLEAKGIPRAMVLDLLHLDIMAAEHDLANILMVYDIHRRTLEGPRYDALVDVCFNVGARSLRGFRRMFAAIKAQDWKLASRELLDSKYARDVKGRAITLSIQLETGRYPNDDESTLTA